MHQGALVLVHEELRWQPDRLRAMIMNISKHFQVCIYIVGGCACVYVCVCDVNVCDCVSFVCISAFHT